eukprot:29023-Chlamydomonas_euryale.AAC.7
MIAARNRACVGRSPLGMPSSMLACRNARRTAGRQAADRAVQASAAGSNQAASAKMLAAGAALTLALAGRGNQAKTAPGPCHAAPQPAMHSVVAPMSLSNSPPACSAHRGIAAGPVHAEKLAEFTGSGFLFRDNIEVTVVDDEGGEA